MSEPDWSDAKWRQRRVARVAKALEIWASLDGEPKDPDPIDPDYDAVGDRDARENPGDYKTRVCDLLMDIRHYCDEIGESFAETAEEAHKDYLEEKEEIYWEARENEKAQQKPKTC